MKKLFLLFLIPAFYICNTKAQVKTYYFDEDEFIGAFFSSVSNNGKYVLGEHPGAKQGILFDRETEEIKWIDCPPVDVTDGKVSTKDISDNGIVVGTFLDPTALTAKGVPCEAPGVYNINTGQWTSLERPEGVINVAEGFMGSASTISADGKRIGGCLPVAKATYKYNGVVWNEDCSVYDILPDQQKNAGARIISMSDDGRVACGWSEDAQYGRVIIWKDGEKLPIDTKGRAEVVSPNGKYVGGNFKNGTNEFGVPFIWTEETGMVAVNCPDTTYVGSISAISDNGRIAVGFVDYKSLVDHHPFIIVDGVYYDFDKYMLENYQVTGPMDGSFFSIAGMSADGSVLCGYAYYAEARLPWILVFDQPLSVSSEKKAPSVNVYPNPVSDLLNIEGEYTSVTLYDNVGTCVLHDTHAAGKVDVSTLPAGIYLVRVMNDRVPYTFKIAVNHK